MRSGICLDGRIASPTTGDRQPLAPTTSQPTNQPSHPPSIRPTWLCHTTPLPSNLRALRLLSSKTHPRPIQRCSAGIRIWPNQVGQTRRQWRVVEVQPCTNPASIAASGASNARTPVSDTLGKRRTAAALPAGRCVGRPPPVAWRWGSREARRHGKDHPMNTSKRLQRVERSMRLQPTASRRPPPSSRCATVQYSPRRPRHGTAPTARNAEIDRGDTGASRYCSIVGPS